MPTKDPVSHEAHDLPLADRIIGHAIGKYVSTASDIALAANGYDGDKAEGYRQGVEQMRHLRLAGWDYRLVPQIVDELRRAGLLAPDTGSHPSEGGGEVVP